MIAKNTQASVMKISNEKKHLSELVDLDDKLNLTVAEVADYREKTTAAYNRVYYVSEGNMSFSMNEQIIRLQKGDACYVEKGTKFELEGSFSVIIVSQPVLRSA